MSDLSFYQAQFTAVISDLHLCDAEPVNVKYPLWKKFKTRQFFFDDTFAAFLVHLKIKSGGEPIELILNGDIFDFDSVMTMPKDPPYRISLIERKRGLFPRAERSKHKIKTILKDHEVFVNALRNFVNEGNRVVFVMGNHDIELHFPEVRQEIIDQLRLSPEFRDQVRFCEWFYISNQDTLVEHGNQYDPYCVCDDPINPYIRGYSHVSLKLPFGNLACRYIMNGMGFFNPHVDSNYIMTMKKYVTNFFRYMVKAQPLLILDWFGGALLTLGHSFIYRLAEPIRNPLRIEDHVNEIAYKANAEPRMVRELKELFMPPAASNPFLLMRELWLDRAFIILIVFYLIFQVMSLIKSMINVSFYWAFIPLFAFLPFFLFYSKSITSLVSGYKEPDDRILAMASAITKVKRIVFGHTHIVRHEMIGSVEHLNPGCWSPAFLDIECTKPLDQRSFVWISPSLEGGRQSEVLRFVDGQSVPFQAASREIKA